ncbi:MAG: hypothetical protein EA355_12435 [Rhodobacteraceae bacterium]|nr:MAG: hypothetical protein EA355_12435 [Paracoccaceae bacterium]
MRVILAFARILVIAAPLAAAAQSDDDRRADYYYPSITSTERFARVMTAPPRTERSDRMAFVDALTADQMAAGHAPRFAVFAKGDEAEHLIIIALDDGVFDTLFRARAVMAQLSAPVRATRFFQMQGLDDRATFYDMLRMIGFATLTLSDGKTWTHRVVFG